PGGGVGPATGKRGKSGGGLPRGRLPRDLVLPAALAGQAAVNAARPGVARGGFATFRAVSHYNARPRRNVSHHGAPVIEVAATLDGTFRSPVIRGTHRSMARAIVSFPT